MITKCNGCDQENNMQSLYTEVLHSAVPNYVLFSNSNQTFLNITDESLVR